MANVRDVNDIHSQTVDVCSIRPQSSLQSLDGLVQNIKEKVNLIKEVEANAKAADDQYAKYEHKLLDTQRENRILVKEKHNCRKEGHIKIANLKTELQKQQQAEKKMRQKLNATLSELKQQKDDHLKLVNQTDDEHNCITKLHALTQQKREDIQRMNSRVCQQQKCLQKLQEELDQLQAALRGGTQTKTNNSSLKENKSQQTVQEKYKLKSNHDEAAVKEDKEQVKLKRERESSNSLKKDLGHVEGGAHDFHQAQRALRKPSVSQESVPTSGSLQDAITTTTSIGNREENNQQGARPKTGSLQEVITTATSIGNREENNQQEARHKTGSLQDVITTATTIGNREENNHGEARLQTGSTGSNDHDRDNNQIIEMPADKNQSQKRYITKNKVNQSVLSIHDDSSQTSTQRAKQVKVESIETNKKLVRMYGQEIKEKVNVINSLLDKIAKK